MADIKIFLTALYLGQSQHKSLCMQEYGCNKVAQISGERSRCLSINWEHFSIQQVDDRQPVPGGSKIKYPNILRAENLTPPIPLSPGADCVSH